MCRKANILRVLRVDQGETERSSLRHLNRLQDGTNADVYVLRRHILRLQIWVRKRVEHEKPETHIFDEAGHGKDRKSRSLPERQKH